MTTWRLPYASVLRQVQPRTGTLPDLDQLELALNRFHYASLLGTLGQGNGDRGILLGQVQTEIDLLNLITSLRLVRHPDLAPLVQQRYSATDVRPLLLEPGGHLAARQLAELVAQTGSLEGLVRGLKDSRYGSALETGWRRYQAGEGGLVLFERELERWQAGQLAAMFSHRPLSIAIPIAYIGLKELEVANLRLMAQAVALELKRDEVQRELIIV
jgi:vacuolar-type H+-ATPase subunit C/Vma6